MNVDAFPIAELPPREAPRPGAGLGPKLDAVAGLAAGMCLRFRCATKAEAVRLGNRLAYMLRDRGVATRHRVNGADLLICRVGECEPAPSRRRKTGGEK